MFVLATASCGGSNSSANPASAPGSEPTSSASTTTTDSTTSTPPTVEATTIAPTTTAPAAVLGGWTPVEPGTEAYNDPPCCTSNWAGVPSPPLPSPGAPLADGEYAVDYSFAWGTDVTKPVKISLHRFIQCSVKEFAPCGLHEGEVYRSNELGIDTGTSYPLTVALDDNLRVVLVGIGRAAAIGNGVSLAGLAYSLNTDFYKAVTARLVDGADPRAVWQNLMDAGVGRFAPGGVYSYRDAPRLKIQWFENEPLSDRRGTDSLGLFSVRVHGGQITLDLGAWDGG